MGSKRRLCREPLRLITTALKTPVSGGHADDLYSPTVVHAVSIAVESCAVAWTPQAGPLGLVREFHVRMGAGADTMVSRAVGSLTQDYVSYCGDVCPDDLIDSATPEPRPIHRVLVLAAPRGYNAQSEPEEESLDTKKLTVLEVISQGTIRADDGNLYVLRGVPDTDEEYGNQAAAKKLVEKAILNAEILIDLATAKDLPDLPGTEVEVFDSTGRPLIPFLAARVAGALANRPVR